MSIDLTGRIALVTGASRGIGRAVALGLARSGAHVVAIARTQGALEALDDEIEAITGQKATLLVHDLLKHEDTDKLGPSIHERFGRLDILIGNAGMLGTLMPAHQIKPNEWEKVMRVNVKANLHLIRSLDPLLRAGDAGRAIFTSSGMVQMNSAYYGMYTASKAALNGMVLAWAAETLQTRMKINLVNPGLVDTKMAQSIFPGGYPPELRARQPEDVVETYLRLCAPDCTRHGEIVEVA